MQSVIRKLHIVGPLCSVDLNRCDSHQTNSSAVMSHTTLSVQDGVCVDATSLASLQDRLDKVEHHVYSNNSDPRTVYSPHRQIANPSPLGLFGFALVSILAGATKLTNDPMSRSAILIPGTALFLGGLAQIVASLFQFLNNNAHSGTTFAVFGLHWCTQAFILTIRGLPNTRLVNDTPSGINAIYFATLTVVTIILWVPTCRMNKVLQATLFLVILVFGFDVGAALGNRVSEIVSGICAIVASTLALYMALLDLVNEAWKKPILPLFPHIEHKKDYDTIEGLPYVPKRIFHKSAFGSVHL